MAKKDIRRLGEQTPGSQTPGAETPKPFNWADGQRYDSLVEVRKEVASKLEDAIRWYTESRAAKRNLGRLIRYSVILFGAAAVAWPTVAELVSKANQTEVKWWLHGATSTLFGVIAAALLLLDRFAGATSGWIRYAIAGMSLGELRDEFRITWLLEIGAWAGQTEPTVDQTKHALTVLQGFISRANQIVHDETNQWKTEFQSALQQIDEYAKTQPKKFETVPCIVKIANPDRLAGQWTVSINDGPEDSTIGDSKAYDLPPGNVRVKVKAEIKTNVANQTRPYLTEMADALAAGTSKTFTVTLPLN